MISSLSNLPHDLCHPHIASSSNLPDQLCQKHTVAHPKLTPSPHLLLLAFPTQGHIIPLLHLAKLLASLGLAVTFVSAEHQIAKLRPLQQDAAAPAPAPAAQYSSSLIHPFIRVVGLPERVTVGELGIGNIELVMQVATHVENDFEQLVQDLRSSTHEDDESSNFAEAPIAVVYDAFLWRALEAANRLNLRSYAFFASPACMLSALLHLPLLISLGYAPLRMSAQPRLVSDVVPGLAPMWDKDLLYFIRDASPPEAAKRVMNLGFALARASTILVNTCYDLEATVLDALGDLQNHHKKKINIQPVGPLLPRELLSIDQADNYHALRESAEEKEKECLRWLDSRPPASVVYVSFGSLFIPSLDDITELALGLEASYHAFLWVLRPPPEVIPNGGSFSLSSLLPESFQARTSDRGFIVSPWAPQLLVLSHPSTGAFLTHCGWNSTLEGIAMGIPLIAWPQFAEQRLNCRTIVDQLKVGMQLQTDQNVKLQREEITGAIRRVMDSEEGKQVRENARELRNMTRKSLKEGGSSFANMQAFVQELFTLSATTSTTPNQEEKDVQHGDFLS